MQQPPSFPPPPSMEPSPDMEPLPDMEPSPRMETTSRQIAARAICGALPSMYSHWSRRNQRLLVLNAGLEFHLQGLWETGFDLTVHSSTSHGLAQARSILGHRAEYMLSQPEALMCDDNFFDYAICLGPLENWSTQTMRDAVKELHRVTATGIIVVFVNAFSPFNAGCLWRKLQKKTLYATGYPACNPLTMRNLLKKEFPTSRLHWYLRPIPPKFLHKHHGWVRLNRRFMRWCPFNAIYGVRIDFTPPPGCTGLVLRTGDIHA